LLLGYLVKLRRLFAFSDNRIPQNVGTFPPGVHGFTLGKTATFAVIVVKPRNLTLFYVLLTLHLGSVLVNKQLDAQFVFFFFVHIYSSSLHVSSTPVLIMRRMNCINTTSGICHSM